MSSVRRGPAITDAAYVPMFDFDYFDYFDYWREEDHIRAGMPAKRGIVFLDGTVTINGNTAHWSFSMEMEKEGPAAVLEELLKWCSRSKRVQNIRMVRVEDDV